jgi:ABC-type multidrug transport system fused ATPase/permease subunit
MTLAARHRRKVFLSSFLAILSVCAEVLPYLCVYGLLLFHGANQQESIWIFAYVCVAALLARPLLFGVSTWLAHIASFDILYDVRLRLLHKLTRLPLSFFTKRQNGSLKRMVNENVEVLELYFSHQLPDMLAAIVMPILTWLLLLYVSWPLALVAIVIVPVLWLANLLIMRGHGDEINRYFGLLGQINGIFVEYLQGLETLKNLRDEDAPFVRLQEKTFEFKDFNADWQKSWLAPWTLFSVSTGASLLFVIPAGVWLLQSNVVTVYDFMFAILCVTGIAAPILKLMIYMEIFLRVQKVVTSIHQLLAEPEDRTSGHLPSVEGQEGIRFRDVVVCEGDKKLLDHITLDIPHHKMTAVIGLSGAGKTTLLRAMCQLVMPSSGEILLGAHGLDGYRSEAITKHIAFVSQDVFLFDATILENIQIGRENATLDEVVQAAKDAKVHDFIQSLPQGYATEIGENGVRLSGGERQRLSLARALISQAPILVLDEITAHVDMYHEYLIQTAINALAREKTIVLSSHRLDSVVRCDHIIMLDKGKVTGAGDHHQLLADNQMYQYLWQLQQENTDWTLKAQNVSTSNQAKLG